MKSAESEVGGLVAEEKKGSLALTVSPLLGEQRRPSS